MRYVQKRCGKCGYTVQSWKTSSGKLFDCPVSICPRCKTILIDKTKKEFVMVSDNPYEYCKKMMIVPALYFAIPIDFFVFMEMSDNKVMALLIAIAVYSIVWQLQILLNKKYYEREAKKSVERTKEKSYLDLLLALNLIDKEEYDNFILKYGIYKTNKEPLDVIDHYEDEVLFTEIDKMKKENGGNPLNLSKKDIQKIKKEVKEKLKYCPHCKSKLNYNDVLCSECGYKLYKKTD